MDSSKTVTPESLRDDAECAPGRLHDSLRGAADEIERLRDKVDALQKFKDFVHARLDAAGVEKDPPGEHRDAGCRIGQRLDLVLGASPSCATPDEKDCAHIGTEEALVCIKCGTVLETGSGITAAGRASLETDGLRYIDHSEFPDPTLQSPPPGKTSVPLKCKCGLDLVPYAGCPACDVPALNGTAAP